MACDKKKDIPDFLFKYRSLDNFCDMSKLKEIIIDKKVYFSGIKNFNDPFEFEHKLTLEAKNEVKKINFIVKQIKWNHDVFGQINLDQTNEEIISAYEKIVSPLLSDFSQLYTHEARNNQDLGVFCLSSDSKNINLWSHYANSHNGICVKFKRIENKCDIIKVEYTSNPNISFYDVPYLSDYYKQASKLKWEKFWAHEDEYRIINSKGHHNINELGFEIDAIYLGINFYANKLALNFIEEIEDIVSNENITILKARKAIKQAYCIEFDEVPIWNVKLILKSQFNKTEDALVDVKSQ